MDLFWIVVGHYFGSYFWTTLVPIIEWIGYFFGQFWHLFGYWFTGLQYQSVSLLWTIPQDILSINGVQLSAWCIALFFRSGFSTSWFTKSVGGLYDLGRE